MAGQVLSSLASRSASPNAALLLKSSAGNPVTGQFGRHLASSQFEKGEKSELSGYLAIIPRPEINPVFS